MDAIPSEYGTELFTIHRYVQSRILVTTDFTCNNQLMIPVHLLNNNRTNLAEWNNCICMILAWELRSSNRIMP
jgi:hypothetical protein